MRLLKGLLCLSFIYISLLSNAQNGVRWISGLTWEQVKQKAKAENKFIFLDAYATWCGPCKKMDNEVYTNKTVVDALNQHFISVRLQMDQTHKDDQYVKNWYSTAQKISQQYSVEGYPSFIFFNSDGKFVYKELGYRDVASFIKVVENALTDPEARYKKNLEKFKNGQLEIKSMPDLAREAYKRKDQQTALEIAKEYKQNFLDKLSDQEAFQPENLSFMADFAWDFMKSKDRYFQLFYSKPALVDSLLNARVRSSWVVDRIIQKEEIIDKIYHNGKPITSKPKWVRYQNSITKKYGKFYSTRFFPDVQITFYEISQDWKNYIKYVNKKIDLIPPQVNSKRYSGYGDAFGVNQNAWTLFLHCNDKKLLSKGLHWVDLAISLDTSSYCATYMDTKANLLYKMNKVKEAIDLQERAVVKAGSKLNERDLNDINENLNRMKAGLPTWQTKY